MVFIFTDAIFVVVFYFFFPETANIPLEEVAALFGDKVAVRLDDKVTEENVEKAVGSEHREGVEKADVGSTT